jgi:fructokinase
VIVVGGESLVDLIARTDELRAVPGGSPFNVSRTIARLGRRCAYLDTLSTDRFGVRLRTALRNDGVDDTWAPSTENPTTLAVAQIGEGGAATYSFYIEGTSTGNLSSDQALAVLAAGPTVLYVGSFGLVLGPGASAYEALIGAVGPDVLLAVDPNCRPAVVRDPVDFRARVARVLARADIVKVSTEDLDYLTPGVDHVTAAQQLRDLGPSIVLVTDGGHAVTAIAEHWRRVVPVPDVKVVDTVGAGDSFFGAVLAHWDASGWGRAQLSDSGAVVSAVEFGVAISGITCGRTGADPPRIAELTPALQAKVS